MNTKTEIWNGHEIRFVEKDSEWRAVHKAITACPEIPRENRLQSAIWLIERRSDHYLGDLTHDELLKLILHHITRHGKCERAKGGSCTLQANDKTI